MKAIKSTEKKQSGQKSKNLGVIQAPSINENEEVEKFDNSPQMTDVELEELIGMVKLECPDSLFLGGYEESIIGYDYISKAIIYDGDKILNRMADAAIQEAIEDGIEIFDRWEYFDDVVDYFEYNVLRFFDCSPTEENRPKPIILRRFI